jgi:hypothetical protein
VRESRTFATTKGELVARPQGHQSGSFRRLPLYVTLNRQRAVPWRHREVLVALACGVGGVGGQRACLRPSSGKR